MTAARLVVVAGLPGAGKTTLAREVAARIGATFLRIDSIETVISRTLVPVRDSPVGYVVAQQVAADQLRAGRPVVADAVNGVEPARRSWDELAREHDVLPVYVEVTCSDVAEHRRRVEQRAADLEGQGLLTWQQVLDREWQPFGRDRIVVDNRGTVDDAVAWVLEQFRWGDPASGDG